MVCKISEMCYLVKIFHLFEQKAEQEAGTDHFFSTFASKRLTFQSINCLFVSINDKSCWDSFNRRLLISVSFRILNSSMKKHHWHELTMTQHFNVTESVGGGRCQASHDSPTSQVELSFSLKIQSIVYMNCFSCWRGAGTYLSTHTHTYWARGGVHPAHRERFTSNRHFV